MDKYSSPTSNEDAARLAEQAALYALGALSQTEAQCVARAQASDPELAAECASFSSVIELLALAGPERSPAATVRQQLLDRIAGETQPRGTQSKRAAAAVANEATFTLRADERAWRQFAPGVFIKTLFVDRSRGTMTTLVQLAPGGRLPRHRHPETEETFILTGSCAINGELFTAGDYRRAPRGSMDGEVTTDDGVVFLMISSPQIDVIS